MTTEFGNSELKVIRDSLFRQIPGKAQHLANVANDMRDMKSITAKDESELFATFIAIHEEIGHMLRVYNRAYEILANGDTE